jgi:zinc D-Ala-D-Ala carboxypeptidase
LTVESAGKDAVLKKGRWIIAFGVWVLAAVLAALLAVIGVRLYLDSRAEPPATNEVKPVPEPTPPAPGPEAPPPKPMPDKPKTEPQKPPQKPVPLPPGAGPVDEDPNKVALCPGISRERAAIAADGTLLGHLPYANASPSDLTTPPASFSSGNCTQMQGEAKLALERMIEAARASDPALGDAMVGLSCFRSTTYQKEVFCRKVGDGFAVRARASAPPGYSEHATGYVMDFGDRNHPECNLQACFATTPVGQWLAANAGAHGFVLSFPKGNAQGVMYEPWHWRFEGSAAAKAVFAGAR